MGELREAARVQLPTVAGEFDTRAFKCGSGYVYLALIKGDLGDGRSVLTRVHSECLTGDALGSLRCDCGAQLDLGMRALVAEGRGVLIYATGHEGRGIGLLDKLRAYMEQEAGADTVDANLRLGLAPDSRRYDDAAAVLKAIGVRSVRLSTNNPRKVEGLQAAGVTVEQSFRCPLPASAQSAIPTHQAGPVRAREPHRRSAVSRVCRAIGRYWQSAGQRQPRTDTRSWCCTPKRSTAGRPAAGDSERISGEAENRISHALRAACDAVLVGVGTVLSDDPQLTVRAIPGPSPARVILDSRLRSPVNAAVFRPDAPTYVMTTARASHPRKRLALAARHVAVRDIRPGPAGLDIRAVLQQLHAEGIRSIIVEGGARVITSMLAAGVAHRVIVSISPRILGRGTDAVGELHKKRITDALQLDSHSVHLVGGTIIVAADIAAPSGLPPDGKTSADAGYA
jgi:3,4-dihydroxy 2-butanone 4-phosphate synthase/GTP cyclohydrolase II